MELANLKFQRLISHGLREQTLQSTKKEWSHSLKCIQLKSFRIYKKSKHLKKVENELVIEISDYYEELKNEVFVKSVGASISIGPSSP